MLTRFLIYGFMGWCMEIIWTGVISLLRKDFKLMASTSLWMFFIYGAAIFLEPFFNIMSSYPLVIRGGVYAACIFFVEYLTGTLLKKADACPWDYSDCKYSVSGVIRLDYAPAWFAAGLIYEYVYRILV